MRMGREEGEKGMIIGIWQGGPEGYDMSIALKESHTHSSGMRKADVGEDQLGMTNRRAEGWVVGCWP